jgi:ribosomal protein S18 acetylase RimI-like enzyme
MDEASERSDETRRPADTHPPVPDVDVPGGGRIRRFRPSDTAAVVALHESALSVAGTDPADVPGTHDLRWVDRAYIDTGGEFLVAETADGDGEPELVGMGGLVVDGTEGELFRFAVDPAVQRGGLGSALLTGLERAARDRGVERLRLSTARRQTAAVQFYAAQGYTETGRERFGDYVLIDFEKRLDE